MRRTGNPSAVPALGFISTEEAPGGAHLDRVVAARSRSKGDRQVRERTAAAHGDRGAPARSVPPHAAARLARVAGDRPRMDDRRQPSARGPRCGRVASRRREGRRAFCDARRRGVRARRLVRVRWPARTRSQPPTTSCIASPGVSTRSPSAISPSRRARGRSPCSPGNRWDDPLGRFAVLYFALSAEAAFAETIARYREALGLLERIDAFLSGVKPRRPAFPAVVAVAQENIGSGLQRRTRVRAHRPPDRRIVFGL